MQVSHFTTFPVIHRIQQIQHRAHSHIVPEERVRTYTWGTHQPVQEGNHHRHGGSEQMNPGGGQVSEYWKNKAVHTPWSKIHHSAFHIHHKDNLQRWIPVPLESTQVAIADREKQAEGIVCVAERTKTEPRSWCWFPRCVLLKQDWSVSPSGPPYSGLMTGLPLGLRAPPKTHEKEKWDFSWPRKNSWALKAD